MNLAHHADAKVAEEEVNGVASKQDDRSIWTSALDALTFHGGFASGHKASILLQRGPRAYMRIVPAGWKNGPPTVRDVQNLPPAMAVEAPFEGGARGDCGACEEGFVRFWVTNKDADGTKNLRRTSSCTLTPLVNSGQSTGSAIGLTRRGPTLRDQSVLRNWARTLKNVIAVSRTMGRSRPTW